MNEIRQAWREGIIIAFINITIMAAGIAISAYILEGWAVAIQFFLIVEVCAGLVCGGLFLPTIIDKE